MNLTDKGMQLIELEHLCTPLDDANPAGPNLEYDPAYVALVESLGGREEQRIGDAVIPAELPNWKRIFEQAAALAERTRDLRIACILTRAMTQLEGLRGMSQGLRLVDALCRRHWACIYPLLDAEDGNDPTMRMNALAPLSDPNALLLDIRNSIFIATRTMGSCTVRELEVALEILTAPVDDAKRKVTMADIEMLVKGAFADGVAIENDAKEAIALARSLSDFLVGQVGTANAADFRALITRLTPIANCLDRMLPETAPAVLGVAAEARFEAVEQSAAFGVVSGGEIRTRQDISRMIDSICAYFERNEPTNPAPLLLRRAQRLSTMNFFEIVRDIAPDALSAVESVAGSKSD